MTYEINEKDILEYAKYRRREGKYTEAGEFGKVDDIIDFVEKRDRLSISHIYPYTSDISFKKNLQLQGVDLSGINLSRFDLTNANLTGANLFEAYSGIGSYLCMLHPGYVWELENRSLLHFTREYLHSKFVEDYSPIAANFSGANLTNANLAFTNLKGVNFTGANFENADFHRTTLTGANLTKAKMNNVKGTIISLFLANPEGADLSGSNIADADLSYANFTNVTISKETKFGDTRTHHLRHDGANYPIRWSMHHVEYSGMNGDSEDVIQKFQDAVDLHSASFVESHSEDIQAIDAKLAKEEAETYAKAAAKLAKEKAEADAKAAAKLAKEKAETYAKAAAKLAKEKAEADAKAKAPSAQVSNSQTSYIGQVWNGFVSFVGLSSASSSQGK